MNISLAVNSAPLLTGALSVGALSAAAIPVWLSGQKVLQARWLCWAVILPVLWLATTLGQAASAVLATAVALAASNEYARLTRLHRADRYVLFAAAVALPAVAVLAPDWLGAAPLWVLLAALAPILSADSDRGFHRAALTGFGAVWISWSLAHLALGWQDAYLVCLAVAAADVGAWCAGTGLRRIPGFAAPLTPLSPNKTRGGVVGSLLGAALVLICANSFSVVLLLVIGLGAVLGDLVESLAKREAGVKDAGTALPGFGGVLDRVDSLLIVLPLAVVLV